MAIVRFRPPKLVKSEDRRLPAADGDEREFSDWWLLMFPQLCNYARRVMMLTHHDAEDVVSDVMFEALQAWRLLRLENRGRGYFFKAVRNAIVDASRARREATVRIVDVDVDAVPGADTPESQLEVREWTGVYESSLAHMPPRVRETLVLTREYGLSYQEAAEAMEVGPDAIRQNVVRGNECLSKDMIKAGYLEAARKQRKLPPSTGTEGSNR